MIFRVRHTTRYTYVDEFARCLNQVHLVPRDTSRQRCIVSDLLVEPTPEYFDRHDDSFGNHVDSFTIELPSKSLIIEANSDVELIDSDDVPVGSPPWESVRDLLNSDAAALDALPFVFESPYVDWSDDVLAFARESFVDGRGILDSARHLMNRIFTEFKFDATATDVGTGVCDVLSCRHGVCQDFTHLMIGCARSLGLAARYVSGYLITHRDPNKPRLVGADVSHAWVSIWCPDAGWMEFDPTNNLSPCQSHITIAYGRDYGDVSPVHGVVLGGRGHKVEVEVDVAPL